MASPVEYFQHIYALTQGAPGSYSYTVGASLGIGANIQDINDYPSGGGAKTDNLTQLGDIGHDEFTLTNGSGKRGGEFIGLTNGQGRGFVFVNYDSGSAQYFLASDFTPGATVQIIPDDPDTPSTYLDLACYVTGSAIRTAAGDVPVERLAVGDRVLTASGEHRSIRWLGHRTLDCHAHPRPREVRPVRIAAHAFGPDRPARDLFVSPGHTVCVDVLGEVLVPAGALINGSTIAQAEVDAVTYWHVELDSHDVLLAENLACESYLDMGNRPFFAESEVVALDAVPDAATPRSHADFCRPYVDGGALLDAIRQRLRERAEAGGWTLAAEPFAGLHLLVDGVRVAPQTSGASARFVVPASAEAVWLVSSAAAPRDVRPGSADPRELGVSIGRLLIDDGLGTRREIQPDDPRLEVGFHAAEPGHRWTAGRARLPRDLWEGCAGDFFLRLDLADDPLPRWVAPVAAAGAAAPAARHAA